MKHISEFLNILCSAVIVILFALAIKGTVQAHLKEDKIPVYHAYSSCEPYELREPVQTVTYETPLVRSSSFRSFTPEECQILEGIALAEARNQGVEGMALVMNVVLNRCDKTGHSIRDVVYAPNQFYTAGMTRGNEESLKALMLVQNGWDESQGALYFCSTGWNYYGNEHLFKYGGHWFSK